MVWGINLLEKCTPYKGVTDGAFPPSPTIYYNINWFDILSEYYNYSLRLSANYILLYV